MKLFLHGGEKMDFTGMAALSQKINSMTLSLQKSETKIKFKKKTEDANKTERQRLIESLQKQVDEQKKNNTLSAIDTKLRSGKVLSASELSYLKQNHPELYEKAMEVKRERQQYENELKACKTKDDVQRVRASKLMNMAAEVSAIANNPHIPDGKKYELMVQINKRAEGIAEAHNEFVRSGEYNALPTDAEVLEEIKEGKLPEDYLEPEEAVEEPIEAEETEKTETSEISAEKPEVKETKSTAFEKAEFEFELPIADRSGKPKTVKIRPKSNSEKDLKQWRAAYSIYLKASRPSFNQQDFSGIFFNKKA